MTKHLLSVVALAALMVLSSCNKPTSATSASASASASNVASTSVAPSASASASVSTSKAVPVESVTLDKTTATLKEGETVTLVATVLPANATNNTGVIWTTSDATIATVADGVVTAVKAGTATISANAGGKSGTCAVTVTEKITQISAITAEGDVVVVGKVAAKDLKNLVINDGTGSILVYFGTTAPSVVVGDYAKVKGAVSIYNGMFEISSATVTKVTDAPAVTETAVDLTAAIADDWAKITTNNTVDAKLYKWTAGTTKKVISSKSGDKTIWFFNMPGSATNIEASNLDTTTYPVEENKAYNVEAYFEGFETKNTYANIVITKLEATTVAPTTLTISAAGDVDSLVRGNTLQMSVAATPVYASNAVTWSSSDTASDSGIAEADQVTISETGLVTAPVTATSHPVTITATTTVTGSTVSATFTLNIVAKLLTVTGQKLVTVGEDITLTTTTSDSATATFTYTTDTAGAAFVTIGTNGKITGKAAGTATITVAADGYTSATIEIQVLESLATVAGKATDATFDAKGVVIAVASANNFVVAEKIGTTTTALLCKESNHGFVKGDYVHISGTKAASYTSTSKAGTVYTYSSNLALTSGVKLTSDDGYTAPTLSSSDITTAAGTSTYLKNWDGTTFNAVSISNSVVSVGDYKTFEIDGFSQGDLTTAETLTEGYFNFVGFTFEATSTGYKYIIPMLPMTAAKRPAATAITVSAKNSETTIEQGATVQLLVSAQTPFGALDDVTWASDKTADATIDANGLVTALATATVGDVVTFTATSKTTATVKNTYQLTITKRINYTAIASYDFSTTATAGTGVTDATTLKALFTSSASTATGFSNIVSATANLSNMYTGYSGYTKFGFKFGSGSGAGKFDATVSSAVAKVVITTVSWGATDTVSVGGDTAQTPGLKYSTATAGVDLTFTFTATTTVNFTYTNRGFISKIVFYAVAA